MKKLIPILVIVIVSALLYWFLMIFINATLCYSERVFLAAITRMRLPFNCEIKVNGGEYKHIKL